MLLKMTLKHLGSKPFSVALTLLAVGISLALLGSFWTLVDNLNRIEVPTENSSENTKNLFIFVDSKLNPSELAQLKKKLQELPELSELEEISPQESLKTLENQFGPTLSKIFEEDSLPITFQAFLGKNRSLTRDETHNLFNRIRTFPGVLDLDDGLSSLMSPHQTTTDRVLSWAKILFAIVFLAVSLLISHVIRLAFESNRSEIETLKVLGASKNWIFTPILLEALILGVLGSILGVLILYSFIRGVVPQYAPLLLPKGIQILDLSSQNLFALIGVGLAASVVGSLMTWPLVAKAPQEVGG